MKLAQLLRTGAPITDRFMHSILDDSLLPNSIKKKAILYYRGDKRLSVPKFIDAITQTKTKKRHVQKGGGWTFGVTNAGYKVTKYQGDDTSGEIKEITTDIKVFTPVSSPVLSPGTSSIKLGEAIGSGNFATVFNITGSEHVFKLFYKAPPQVLNAIETNLTQFLKTGIATVFPSQDVSKVIFNDVYKDDSYSSFGYKMINCDSSLSKKLVASDISTHVNDALGKLTNTSFVHGDIKLDNIMLQGATVHISDWDGVYMYDDALSTGPPPCVCFSPATAHPYYLWYVATFKERKDMNEYTFKDLDPGKTHIDAIWNIFLKDDNATAKMIKDIVNGLYGGFATHAKQHLTNTDWHRYMLKICDRYSLGMSLLLCAKQNGNTAMMTKGVNIISEACKNFRGGSGGRRKSIRSGGDLQQAYTDPHPHSKAMSADLLAKAAEAPSANATEDPVVESILSILSKYNLDDEYDVENKITGAIDQRKNGDDLNELMKTNMFVPDSLLNKTS